MTFFKDGLGRKFVTCASLQSMHVILLFFDKINSSSYETLTLMVLGALIGGNLGEKIINKNKE